MSFTAERLREYRKELAVRGICPRCHKRELTGGHKVCDECRANLRANSKKRFEMGLCKDCGGPLDNQKLKRCINCTAVNNEKQFWRRQRI